MSAPFGKLRESVDTLILIAEPSGVEEFYRQHVHLRASLDAAIIRELLGRWVSEIEPVIWRDARGVIIGIGDGNRIVISAGDAGAVAQAIRDDFLEAEDWRE